MNDNGNECPDAREFSSESYVMLFRCHSHIYLHVVRTSIERIVTWYNESRHILDGSNCVLTHQDGIVAAITQSQARCSGSVRLAIIYSSQFGTITI